jgi:Bifunctional DNA primase/polymerase, N-terminal
MISTEPAGFNRQSVLLEQALAYRQRGWSIIAVKGKKSVGLWKPFQDEPADEKTLRRIFAKPGITGLAVVCGAVSGDLAVRDFDQIDAYHDWAAAHPEEARICPTVRTSRGYHLYGQLNKNVCTKFNNGELRASCGCYVLLPPSVHPDGPVYSWLNPLPSPSSPLPSLPLSLTGEWNTQATQAIQATQQPTQPMQLIACATLAGTEFILATLPDGPGQRNRKIWDLVRRLKALPNLDTSPAALKLIVEEWHRLALPFIATKNFDETWSDFKAAWLRPCTPFGASLEAAYKSACQNPQSPIDDNPNIGVLAALCRNLSTRDGTFYLAAGTVEKLFGVSRTTALRWLQSLCFYGVIELTKTGTLKDRQASEWRFITGK